MGSHRHLLFIFLLTAPYFSNGQFVVTREETEYPGKVPVSGLYAAVLHNFSDSAVQADIKIVLSDTAAEILYHAVLTNCRLLPGETRISLYRSNTYLENIHCAQEQGNDPLLKDQGGKKLHLSYTITPRAGQPFIAAEADEFLFEMEVDTIASGATGQAPEPGRTPGRSFLSDQVQIGGTVAIDHQSSVRTGSNRNFPANYTNVFFSPELTVFGVPLRGNILLSSLDTKDFRNISYAGFSLDTRKWKEEMRRRSEDKGREVAGRLRDKYLSRLDSLTGSYKELSQLLADTGKLKLPELPDSLRKLQLPADTLQLPDSLKDRWANDTLLQQFREKKAGYDRLKQKQDSVTRQLMALREAWQAIASGGKGPSDSLAFPADSFDFSKYKDLRSQIDTFGKSSRGTGKGFLSGHLQSLDFVQVGLFYPVMHDLLAKGAGITGVNIGFQKERYFYAVHAGKINTLLEADAKAYSGSATLGLGNRERSFAALTYIYNTNTTSGSVNRLLASTFRKEWLEQRIVLDGIVATSHTGLPSIKKEILLPGNVSEQAGRRSESWLKEMFRQHPAGYGRIVDHSWDLGATFRLFKKRTELTFRTKKTGDQYASVLSPFLIKGNTTTEAGLKQSFWKNRIQTSAKYAYTKSNKEVTYASQVKQFQGNVRINIPRLPVLSVLYNRMDRDIAGIYRNTLQLWNLSTSYTKKIFRHNHCFSANYLHQQYALNGQKVNTFSSTLVSDAVTFSKTTTAGINYLFSSRQALNGVTLYNQAAGIFLNRILSKKLTVNAGCTYAFSQAEQKTGATIAASYALRSCLTMGLGYGWNNYTAYGMETGYMENNLKVNMIYKIQ